MRILMVASEVAPHAKTGGLADVLGSLPTALRELGHDVRVLMPRYSSVELPPNATAKNVLVPFDGTGRAVKIWGDFAAETAPLIPAAPTSTKSKTTSRAPRAKARVLAASATPIENVVTTAASQKAKNFPPPISASTRETVPTYFLDAPEYFARPRVYGYDDDILRFGFFSRAALELPRAAGWIPDIIHCHDWHTGLLPLYLWRLKSGGAARELASTRTVFSIHNLAYQGLARKEFLPRLGLDWSLFNLQELEYFDRLNPLKAGLVFSDEVTTVSPTYAREIQTPQFGEGLQGVLEARSGTLKGITNGIDETVWNPKTDAHLAARYDVFDLSSKRKCKRDLQGRCGFDAKEDAPILGMVSRLSSQKGFDLVARALRPMLAMGCRFVLLGSGDERYVKQFHALQDQLAPRVSMHLGKFDDELAHRIYAGADFFLMPSRYEPCGLGQLIALRYGTIPIVRETGGLADTVTEFDAARGVGNGFLFGDFEAGALLDALAQALEIYRSPHWNALRQSAMSADFSWRASAARYETMYQTVVRRERKVSD